MNSCRIKNRCALSWLFLGSLLICVPVSSQLKVCFSQPCREEASFIAAKLNKLADPCKDFYDFACGNYVLKKPRYVPEEETMENEFERVQAVVYKELSSLLARNIKANDNLAIRAAKQLYRSCFSAQSTTSTSYKTFEKILEQLGGWPLFNRYNWDDIWTWDRFEYTSAKLGIPVDYIINVIFALDMVNSSKRAFMVRNLFAS